jgi:hypothetical protein
MNNKTIFMAALLAIATVLAVGLTVLPGSIQEAQANPCADEVTVEIENEDSENPDGQSVTLGTDASSDDRECNFIGPVELDED